MCNSLLFQSYSSERARMFSFLRSSESDKLEKRIERFFQSVGSNCKERQKQLKVICTVSSHDTLKSIMSSLGIDVTKSLENIHAQCLELMDYDDQPGIKEFVRQWKAYVQYLYGSKTNQDKSRGNIDSRWFEKRVSGITFATVFTCELWINTSRDATDFSLLGANTVSSKRHRPEDLLAAGSHLLQGTGTSTEEKRDIGGVIAEHVAQRKNIAKTRVYAGALSTWATTKLEPFHLLHRPLVPDIKPELKDMQTLSNEVLHTLVDKQHTGSWKTSYENLGAELATQSSEWVKMATEHYDQQRKELEAKQKSFKDDLRRYLSLSLVQRLDAATLARFKSVVDACPDTALIDYIQNNWPVLVTESSNKRPRLQGPSLEHKSADDTTVGAIKQLLDNTPAGTSLAEWCDVVTQVMTTLKQDKVKDPGPEPLEKRQAMINHAVQMDLAAYCREIAERVAVDPSAVLKRGVVRSPALDAYHAWEKQLREGVQEAQGFNYEMHQDIQQALFECWQRAVYGPLCSQLQQLRDGAKQQARTIAVYVPWMDTVQLSAEEQQALKQVTCDIPAVQNSPCPTSLSGALVQCTSWFEHAYRADVADK